MIINQLTLYNFGVYAGINTFEFSHEKPVVLIGGMNGRGKTTLLDAILIALYGANSTAYTESRYKSYSQYLRSYVNNRHCSQSSYIELEFTLDDASKEVYTVKRAWDALSKITKEVITVHQNGEYNDFLTTNWQMFVENIMPCALSSFYFFDGEKIAELAVDNTDQRMKNSIRAMMGITVLDVLKNDLNKILRKLNNNFKDGDVSAHLNALRSNKDLALAKLADIDSKMADISAAISDAQENIEHLYEQYEVCGGLVIEQREELIRKRASLHSDLNQNAEALIEVASGPLPLYLVYDLVSQIKFHAEEEQANYVMKQALAKLNDYLAAFAKDSKQTFETGEAFLEYVRQQAGFEAVSPIYKLPNQSLFQVNDLIENLLEDLVNHSSDLLEQKIAFNKRLDEIDSYLTLNINEIELVEIRDDIKKEEDVLLHLNVDLSRLQQDRVSANAEAIALSVEYNRYIESYLQKIEALDDADRKLKYANMAIRILEDYSVELQKKKTTALGKTITKCYKKLANKKTLIQKIIVDPETLDIQYLDDSGKAVLKESLSAGEKQLMVIAILWALAMCSKEKLPVIIDTPLSRLDSQHRASVVATYFPNASNQTIILSTDTEIDRNYYSLIKDFVGDEFTLVYNEGTKSTSIRRGYF